MTLEDCSTVRAFSTITLRGDHGSADSSGSVMDLLGTLDAGDGNYNVLVYGGTQRGCDHAESGRLAFGRFDVA
jgi:hypothetical protein